MKAALKQITGVGRTAHICKWLKGVPLLSHASPLLLFQFSPHTLQSSSSPQSESSRIRPLHPGRNGTGLQMLVENMKEAALLQKQEFSGVHNSPLRSRSRTSAASDWSVHGREQGQGQTTRRGEETAVGGAVPVLPPGPRRQARTLLMTTTNQQR